ncbi:RidA family protein [Burkholderia lata]|uniref:RidA family protein n=1 Tax=Burkholderia lata (strain ATCC 17760 / DSM 23089 / LMG 22485 / NCIMB 9086 / R18194 / 383) TaxID=482957 RepID=UPI0014534308|nr:RidA family protein [Burkholderia lata]VWB87923.1 L-PSP family endoribonuclease [Burkholderia lata]
MQSIDSRLQELGIELPIAPPAAGLYTGAVTAGNLVFISGQGPLVGKSVKYVGSVGSDLSEQEGYEAARLTALNALAALKAELGSLDRVKRIVKVLAWVRSAPGFQQQPSIVNGYSQLMLDVFGEKGVHARSALSAHELAFGMAFEAEMVVEIYQN